MAVDTFGQSLIWLALILNLGSGLGFLMAGRGNKIWQKPALNAYHLFAGISMVAVVYLFYLFLSHNYAFKYVYDYSELSQPLFYIISAFWGGQEGTYLLWLAFSVVGGYFIIRRGGAYTNYAMAVYALVNLFFLFLLLKVSPFALLPTVAADGLGLNPLLRDPWMVIHPPVIFVGYALCGIPFALAMAALIKKDYSEWVKRAFPWAAAAALFLAAGNVLGGYWAYVTLGWGGYWAWDPVENSSLVPWIISIALVHGLLIEKRTGALRRTNLLMAAFLFLLVIYGTFLTRSGVLADFSVHSFADLGINANLIGFMVFYVAISLGLFLWRTKSIKSAPLDYNYFGREFVLFASMMILFFFGLVVIFWSSLPIFSGWFGDEPRAANIPTYNSFAIPLATLMAFMLTVVPIAKYATRPLEKAGNKALLSLVIAALIGFGLFHFVLGTGYGFALLFTLVAGGTALYLCHEDFRVTLLPALGGLAVAVAIAVWLGVREYQIMLFYGTAAMAVVASTTALIRRIPDRLSTAGAPLTHLGFSLMLIGIMTSSNYDQSDRLFINRGETAHSEKFNVTVGYQGMVNHIEHPNNELSLMLDEGSGAREVRPQLFWAQRMEAVMRRPYVSRSLTSDLYLAPQQIEESNHASGLVLKKGESKEMGGFVFKFVNFEMGDHEAGGVTGMRVAAVIDVFAGEDSARAVPAMIHTSDANGQQQVSRESAHTDVGEHHLDIGIQQILADQGSVVLSLPDLMPDAKPERLILDLSWKPMINLVWFGTTLLMIGSILSFTRRRRDLDEAIG